MPLYAGLVAIGFWLAAGSVQRAFTSHLSRRRELLEALTTGLGRVCVGG